MVDDITNPVEQVSKLSEAISKYGPVVVILAVFLLIFIGVVIWLIKSNQKYINQMAEQNNMMFQKLFSNIEAKNYDEEDIIEIFTKLNEVFKEECKKINEKTGSSRSAIYVFHNGSISSHGLPFFKMTCVSEWIARGSGFQEQLSKHTNLNLALFSSLVEELYNNGDYVILRSPCEEMEPYTYAFMSEKAKTSIFTCVYDSNNRIMAFINSEFKEQLDEQTIDNVKTIMKNSCAKVQPVLEFSSYKDKKYDK